MSEITRRSALATAISSAAGVIVPTEVLRAFADEALAKKPHGQPASIAVMGPPAYTPEERKEFGQRLREAREACQARAPWLTLESVAGTNGIEPADLAAWEAGEREPSALHALRLSWTYCVQLEWLLYPDGVDVDSDDEQTPDIGSQLAEAREKAGLDDYRAALLLGVPIHYWQEIEDGERRIDFALGVRACLAFGVDPVDMVRPEQ